MSRSSSFARALFAAGLSVVLLISGCGSGGGGSSGPSLSRVEVTPTNPSIAKGTTQAFTATAVMSNGATQDVTASASWASSDTSVATVSNVSGSRGVATGVAQGAASVTATYGGLSGSTTLTVTAAVVTSLAVTPTNPSVAKGTTKQFTATATFSDSTTQNVTAAATWTSSDTGVATISNATGSEGLAQSIAVGSTTITASYQGQMASSTLSVTSAVLSKVQVTPSAAQIPAGRTQQYTATGIYTDGTKQDMTADATWSTSNASIISISNAASSHGLAAANAAGTATISAAVSGGLSGSTGVTVTSAVLDSIQISPRDAKLAKGFTRAYTATGIYSDGSSRDITADATWASTDTSVATISNAAGSNGLATGVAAGVVSVSAQLSGVSQSTLLTVTNATLTGIQISLPDQTIPLGTGLKYSAVGTFSDNSTQDLTTQVTWTSSDTAVATVSNAAGSKGEAQSVAVGGPVTITATNSGQTGSTTLTVSAAALQTITVTRDSDSIPKGRTDQFTARGAYTDGKTKDITTDVTWTSSDSNIASVSNANGSEGLATGLAAGQVDISAELGGVTGIASLTVTNAVLDSIAVAPTDPSATGDLPKGRDRQYTATGTYSDNSTRDITSDALWSSNAEGVATVSNSSADKGLAHAVSAGNATILASLDGKSGSTVLTVSNAVLDSIAIDPADPQVAAGLKQQLSAIGTYSDGSTLDMTNDVTWDSSDLAVVEVSNSANSKGLAYARAPGSATITATDPGSTLSGTTSFTTLSAVLQSITVTPSNANPQTPNSADIPVGYFLQFAAMGHFSDADRDITSQVNWTSFDPTVVAVNDSDPDKGYAEARAVGTTTVVATLNGVQGTATAAAVATTLDSIDVTPKNDSFSLGDTKQFTATGIFSSGLQLDMTRQVTWASSNQFVATISNASGSEGLATAQLLPSSTTISATFDSVSGSTTLTLGPSAP